MDKTVLINILLEKFKSKKAKIGIVGMGYVGVPLGLRIIEAGFDVIGYDTNEDRVRLLTSGKPCFSHINPVHIRREVQRERFKIYSAPDHLSYCDVILICVPTPLTESREPDLNYVEQACYDISRNLRKGQLIILESSTYPGTTETVVASILENNANDYELNTDYFLGYSPEREDPGNKKYNVKNIPKIVSGVTPESAMLVQAFYTEVVDKTVALSSVAAAEMVKILENTYRAVNIALVNELKVVCHRLNIDIWEVIQAAKTKPFGYKAFYPSAGVGGHCISCDPHYLAWRARQVEIPTRFIDLAGEVNWEMSKYVVQRVLHALNTVGKCAKKANIMALGVTYKKNINDLRESAALKVMRDLMNLEANVIYHDPHAPSCRVDLANNTSTTLISQELSCEKVKEQDCVVLLTDHDCINYSEVFENANLIVDTRHRFSTASKKVIQA